MASKTPKHIIRLINEAGNENATFLDLSRCGLTKVPEEIFNLSQLTNLNISFNQLGHEEAKILAKLKGLVQLNIGHNRIGAEGAKELARLESLIHLDIRINRIGDEGAKEIATIKGLKNLDVQSNRIGDEGAKAIANLKGLRDLNIAFNEIGDIGADEIATLPLLNSLDISENKISTLRSLLPLIEKGMNVSNRYKSAKGLMVSTYALTEPPQEIVSLGTQAIFNYYKRIDTQGKKYIFEAKLVLVGDGETGKTSLLNRIMDEKSILPSGKDRTRGIKITDWQFDKDENRTYTAHIWDFGGQDVYFPVHRFFLTKNAVFVLLDSTRRPHHNFHYWIPTIHQFGGSSPIIIGQTLHDGNTKEWTDIGSFQAKSEFNIIATKTPPYFQLDLRTLKNIGLQEIKDSIVYQISHLPHFGKAVPTSWSSLRDRIEENSKKKDCITFEEFSAICKEEDKDKKIKRFGLEDIEDVAKFFHELGIILWFHEDAFLRDWIILKPQWAMNAVYAIIDDEKIQMAKGHITANDFKHIWSQDCYRSKHNVLRKLLEVFRIAFPKRFAEQDYILPCRLDAIKPEERWQNSGAKVLSVEYLYDFMPRGLLNQLSAELSSFIEDHIYVWQDGVQLKLKENETRGEVLEDYLERKITLKAKGIDARSILLFCMNTLNEINSKYLGLTPKILIPCTCTVCSKNIEKRYTFDYELLVDILKSDDDKVWCNRGREFLVVENILHNSGFKTNQEEASVEIPKELKEIKTIIQSIANQNAEIRAAVENNKDLILDVTSFLWAMAEILDEFTFLEKSHDVEKGKSFWEKAKVFHDKYNIITLPFDLNSKINMLGELLSS